MDMIEELNKMISENLKCLGIRFMKNMFKRQPIKEFERIGHDLLMIIDEKECTKTVPWPLVKEIDYYVYRVKFCDFINNLNLMYPEAFIPPIHSCSLLAPSGKDFLFFVVALSTFALKIYSEQVINETGHTDLNQAFIQPETSKQPKDLESELQAIYQDFFINEENILRNPIFNQYTVSAFPIVEVLTDECEKLEKQIESMTSQMETVIESLKVNNTMMQQYMNLEAKYYDEDFTGFNIAPEEKLENEKDRKRLLQYRDLVAKCRQWFDPIDEPASRDMAYDDFELLAMDALDVPRRKAPEPSSQLRSIMKKKTMNNLIFPRQQMKNKNEVKKQVVFAVREDILMIPKFSDGKTSLWRSQQEPSSTKLSAKQSSELPLETSSIASPSSRASSRPSTLGGQYQQSTSKSLNEIINRFHTCPNKKTQQSNRKSLNEMIDQFHTCQTAKTQNPRRKSFHEVYNQLYTCHHTS